MNDLDRVILLLNASDQPRLAGFVGNVRAALRQLVEAVETKADTKKAVAVAKDLLRDSE